MQNFQETKRFNTSQSVDHFRESLRGHVKRVANSVSMDGTDIVATRLRTSIGNHPYRDVTRFTVTKSGNGIVVDADVKFKMTILVWMLIGIMLITFGVGFIILFACGSMQTNRVKKELQSILDMLESECQSSQSSQRAMAYQQPQMAPPNLAGMGGGFGWLEPEPEAKPDPIKEVERLGALLSQGLLTQDEFSQQKRKLLGLPDKPAAQHAKQIPAGNGRIVPSYFIRRGEKIVGPLNVGKLKEMRSQKKLMSSDLIAVSDAGPWFRFPEVHKAILDEGKVLPNRKA